MKRCTTCVLEKPLDQFNRNAGRRDGLQSKCRECQRAWYRAYYQDADSPERARVLRSNAAAMLARRGMIAELKSVPCADCGQTYPPYVMDFDHLGDKLGDIANNLKRWSNKKLLAEVAKCEVVCSNCHRARTHARMN